MAVENIGPRGESITPQQRPPGTEATRISRSERRADAGAVRKRAGDFSSRLEYSDRMTRGLPTGPAIRADRVAQARERIAAGYYEQPVVKRELAVRLLGSLGLDRED